MKPSELPPSNWRELSASELESENLKAAIKRLDTCETLNLALELFHGDGARRWRSKGDLCKWLRLHTWELARLYQIWQEKNRDTLGEPTCRTPDKSFVYFWNFWTKKVQQDLQGGLNNA